MSGYMSMSQSIRANGDRHRANAERHLAEGHPEYAAGSMRKAHRNWKRAYELEEWLRPKNYIEAAIFAQTKRAIEDNLFKGSGEGAGGLADLFRE